MENVCRVCTSSDVTLVDIYAQREQPQEQLCLEEILNECVNCEVRPNDPLPKQICLSCVLDAQNAFQFKRRCEQSHQHFFEMLRNKDNYSDSWLCKREVEEIDDVLKVEEFVVEQMEAGNLPPQGNSKDVDSISTANASTTTGYQCDICDEAFPNKTNLMVHAFIHNNGDPDKCPHCGKVFTSRGSLTRHIRVHSGERPYKCVYCGKSFTQRCNLDKHVRIHSGERPYKCRLCQKAFTQSSPLVSHMRVP